MKTYNGEPRKYCQVKLDGHWLEVKKQDGLVTCTTRRPTVLDLRWCPWMINVMSRVPDDTVLHGELWTPGKPASYVKTAIAQKDTALQFSPYAIVSDDVPASAMLENINDNLARWGLKVIPFWSPCGLDWDWGWAQTYHYSYAEGLVYKDGNLLNHEKWKPVLTADLIVYDIKYAVGDRYLGLVGSLICGLADGTIIAHAGGLSEEDRETFTKNPPIGQVVEVEYQRVESRGRLRHPRFVRIRDDKRPEECDHV